MKFELAIINLCVCVCVCVCLFESLESVKFLRFGMMWVVFFELGISEFLKLQ